VLAFGLCYEAIIVVRPTDDTAVHPQQARILSPSRGCAHSVKHSNLLQTKERDRSMQRLATYFTGPQATSSHQFRSFSTRHTGWPYSPSADAQSHASTSGSVSSSPAHQAAKTSLSKPTVGLSKTVHDILEQIKHLKGAREMWEVAVKRNGMTTSLVLLGGVLLADLLMFPGNKRQAALHTSLAGQSSSSGSSRSQATDSSSSSSSSHLHAAPSRFAPPPPGSMPAHA
jgi:hypothetical protein